MIANEGSQTFLFSIMAKKKPDTLAPKPKEKVPFTAKLSLSPKHKDLIALMLKKANLTTEDLLRAATVRLINNNLDLLTETEIKQYKDLLV